MANVAKVSSRQYVTHRHQEKRSKLKGQIKWSWATRLLKDTNILEVDTENSIDIPIAGDLGLFKIRRIGNHKNVVTSDNKKLRLYSSDYVVGVFGNRYATDAFEGEIETTKSLSLMTAGGMVGTVKSKHNSVGRPTQLGFVGYLKDSGTDSRINLKKIKFRIDKPVGKIKNLIVIIGSGMNSGKTTTCRKVIKSFSQAGFKTVACKLTGSVSPRDQDEMVSAAALKVMDFSDYGFPSTYKCDREELLDLFNTMLADIEKVDPDVVIMEIADGVLQRETKMLLSEPLIKNSVSGIIVTADSAPAALYTVNYLDKLEYKIFAVSGAITSSPLYMKEFKQNSSLPLISSAEDEEDILDPFKSLFKSDK